MSFKQCPGCEAMVSSSKAYCPDCGTPMDEEQKRSSSSEYDSLMKTQNLGSTSQLKLLEEINLNTFFNVSLKSETEPPRLPIDNKETKPVETKAEPIQPAQPIQSNKPKPVEKEVPQPPSQPNRTEGQPRPLRFNNSSENFTQTIRLMPQAEAKATLNQPSKVAAESKKEQIFSPGVPVNNKQVESRVIENKVATVNNQPTGTPSKPKKTPYIIVGIFLLLFALAVISITIIGILYWNSLK